MSSDQTSELLRDESFFQSVGFFLNHQQGSIEAITEHSLCSGSKIPKRHSPLNLCILGYTCVLFCFCFCIVFLGPHLGNIEIPKDGGPVGTEGAELQHRNTKTRSELHLQHTTQLMAMQRS